MLDAVQRRAIRLIASVTRP
nr:unnamed protein product [Callosobruchus chinensis]